MPESPGREAAACVCVRGGVLILSQLSVVWCDCVTLHVVSHCFVTLALAPHLLHGWGLGAASMVCECGDVMGGEEGCVTVRARCTGILYIKPLYH